ncbi:uncharacterized protein MEPE_05617 [Melanopsichium pennsylvanicum]|uniref:Uncharacterized protein n=1 Tax=Melanopsichium pennsylvanicum TaxID=63383 RepID=A0AAJ5C7U7_9BASI|nr:uncharacterized protein MEPE_05617 [Melanopsichium pennsylvanicum]
MSSSTQQPSPTNKLGEQELCIDCQPEVPSQADSLRSGSSIIQVEAVKSSQTPDEEEQGQKKEDLMDPTTFIPPISTHADTNLPRPMIIVEVSIQSFFPPPPFLFTFINS